MRRRRQTLQVSTFPFLAVLLCAMGSLILLLLVLDRRARAVALARAQKAAGLVAREEEQVAQARQAEWEQRRRNLHALLEQQEEELQNQVQGVQNQLVAVTTKFQTEQECARALQEKVQAERTRLTLGEQEIQSRRSALAQDEKQTEATRAEMRRLTAEVEQLEQALVALKAVRQRDQQTYSLVPYRGKRGDNRRPLYIECARSQLVFHPDRLTLSGPEGTAGPVRSEIERRIAQRHKNSADASQEQHPYLLFLVRPDGITTYYQTLAALHGLAFEFGYEFVDRDWILDFPEDDGRPGTQPWMAAGTPVNSSGAVLAFPTNPRTPVTGIMANRQQGMPLSPGGQPAGGNGATGYPSRPAGDTSPVGGATGQRGSAAGFMRDGVPVPGSANAFGPAPFGTRGNGIGGGNLLGDGPGLAPRSLLGQGAGPDSAPEGPLLGDPGGSPARASLNGDSVPSPRSIAGLGGSGRPGPRATSSSMPGVGEGSAGPPGATSAGGTISAPGSSTLMSGSTQPPPTSTETGEPATAQAGLPSATLRAPVASGTQGDTTTGSGNQGIRASGSQERLATNPSRGEDTEGGTNTPLDPLDPLTPPSRETKPPVPLRPARLVGNRDWVISVECTPDGLVVPQAVLKIPVRALDPGQAGANQLLGALREMITRRQASVRPGEPSYRPQIRFLVRHDGFRSYYLAYPILETLRIPMNRQNLDQEETKPGNVDR